MDTRKHQQKFKMPSGRPHVEKSKPDHAKINKKSSSGNVSKFEKNRHDEPSSYAQRRNPRDVPDDKIRDHERKGQDHSHDLRNRDKDSDSENKRHHHKHHHKKRPHGSGEEESFEELSRRKEMIESQLNALDEEEAAAASSEEPLRTRRKLNRNHADHHTSRPVHIKQEPVSDDERGRRQRRPSRTRRRDSASSGSEHGWGKPEESRGIMTEKEKAKPNFETSGKLTEDTNTFNGVVIKYNEPAEARKPRRKWRLYPFKGDTSLPFIPVHRQSAYLLGRSRLIADIPIDHPSCSKQHAVLQFRHLPYQREDGTTGKSVRPYIIDLDSSNGTYVNNKRIDPRRYVELLEKDVLKFGFSTRVYVLLHEESKNEERDS